MFIRQEAYEKAVEAFKGITDQDPNFAEGWYFTGLSCSKLGRYEEASEAFKKALEINSALRDTHDICYQLGISNFELGSLRRL